MPDDAVRCLIALGGNTGPVPETFERALAMLTDAGCGVEAVSSNHSSAPMGAAAGDPFVNAAACVTTQRTPSDLLQLLQQVEDDCGRVRTVHWGPRRLDLDLLCYAEQVIQSPTLIVPHPGLWYRRFVLDPVVEIAADWVHAPSGLTMAELHARLRQQPLVIELDGGDAARELPDRYSKTAAVVGINQPPQSLRDSDHACFCRMTVTEDDEPNAHSPELSPFEIRVTGPDVGAMLDAVLTAALGY